MITNKEYKESIKLIENYNNQRNLTLEKAMTLFCEIYGYEQTEGVFVESGYKEIRLSKDGNILEIKTYYEK